VTEGLYDVSDHGRVRTHRRRGSPGGILRPHTARHGYLVVNLRRDNGHRTHYVHRLVAAAFHGAPQLGQQTRHLDGDPLNNHADNLAWGTPLENADDTRRHGTHNNTRKTHCKQGHSLTDPANVIHTPKQRRCRACKTESLRRTRLQTHCKHGHPLEDGNVTLNRRGYRLCLTCRTGVAA
jgi:hypothetical protein